MKHFGKLALGAVMLAGTAMTAVPAQAVAVRIGIGGPIAPPCAYTYSRCGYYNYSYPVYLGGRWYHGPHYYRWSGGRPWVWLRGGWHVGFGGGWRGHGWHGGGHPGWHGGGHHWHH